jgi:hypothetical protein
MQSLGAFLQCYKSPMATYKCLESFREHYPDSTIVLLSDNGYNYENMAKHFNCIYIHSDENVSLCNKNLVGTKYIENVNKIIDRFTRAFNLITEDYVMWLEDDVTINGMVIDIFKYDINGFCPNRYSETMIKGLQQTYPFITNNKIYRWSGHGGSVFHRENALRYFENKDIINDVLLNWKKYNLTDDICHDFFISLLVNLNDGTIGSYYGHADGYNGMDKSIAVQHQYKVWYSVDMPSELRHLVSSENI